MLRDQRDLLCAFNAEGVEYLVVGGHEVNAHGLPRLTKDLDVFIQSSPEKSESVFRALVRFGAPLVDVTASDFHGHPDEVFQIGVEPNRIDVMQAISAVDFAGAWERRSVFEVEAGIHAPFVSLDDLLANKIESGRLQDLADVERLIKMRDGR